MKEIFVFGAGASHSSGGTPLGKDLGWTYFANCSDFNRMAHGKPAPDDIAEKKKEFDTQRQFLILAENLFPELKGEEEKWEKSLNNGATYLPPYDLNKKYYVDEMLRIAQKNGDRESMLNVALLKRIIFEHIVESSFASGNSLYGKFMDIKLNNRPSSDITIISFNFDFLLREDFKDKEEVYFDYIIDFDYIDDKRRKIYNKSNSVSLIKLNGSLDWGVCKACNKINLFFPQMRSRDYGIKCMGENCQGKTEPLIIAPHTSENNRLEILWSKAKEKLNEAEKITIIGYSFPPYDKKVIELFANCINSDIKLEVVDYEENSENFEARKSKIRQDYKGIFPCIKQDIEIELGGFEKYVAN